MIQPSARSDASDPVLRRVQMALRHLPDHVARLDLLEFRAGERRRPSGWPSLADATLQLLDAIAALRGSPGGSEAPARALAQLDAPGLYALGGRRFDTLTPAEIGGLIQEAREGPPGSRQEIRLQLSLLLEERLLDLALEGAHVIRKSRRYPRLPAKANPLCPFIESSRALLDSQAHGGFEAFARLIGAIPADPTRRPAPRDRPGAKLRTVG